MTQQNASKWLLRNDSKIELLDINTLSYTTAQRIFIRSLKFEKCKIAQLARNARSIYDILIKLVH